MMHSVTKKITKLIEKKDLIEKDPLNAAYLRTLSHPAPYFFFSKARIIENYSQFKKFFPDALIYYAMKANSEPEVLTLLSSLGSGFEVASRYELDILKKLKVDPKKIIYGTSIKPGNHVKDFHDYGVDTYSCDSISEMEKVAAGAPGAKIYVRVSANDSGSVFRFSEKFGTDIKNVVPILKRAKELGLVAYGISFNIGSQSSDPAAWSRMIKEVHPLLEELKKNDILIEVLNIGGGYPCKYASDEEIPTLEEISGLIYEEYVKLPFQPKLALEPGRGIIASSGVLIASVIARVERKEYTWLFLDAGCYNALFESMAYQGSTRYSVTSLDASDGTGKSHFALAGPTGDSSDVITREALLPANITVGDLLVFHNVGAYNLTAWTSFNGFPRPEVYYA